MTDNDLIYKRTARRIIDSPRSREQMLAVLEGTPPIVEIIRCRDCKHRDPEDKKCDCGHDIVWNLPRQDDWFCADAKRRTDGN